MVLPPSTILDDMALMTGSRQEDRWGIAWQLPQIGRNRFGRA
jgi:hypothetical protein